MRIGPDETSPSRSGRKRGMESRRQAVKAFVGTSSRFFVSLAAGEKKNGHREPSRRPCDRASLVSNATPTSSQERCRPVGAITMAIGRREGCQRRERRLQLSLARSLARQRQRNGDCSYLISVRFGSPSPPPLSVYFPSHPYLGLLDDRFLDPRGFHV